MTKHITMLWCVASILSFNVATIHFVLDRPWSGASVLVLYAVTLFLMPAPKKESR